MTAGALTIWLYMVRPQTGPRRLIPPAPVGWSEGDTALLRRLLLAVLRVSGTTGQAKPPGDKVKTGTQVLSWVWWTLALIVMLYSAM